MKRKISVLLLFLSLSFATKSYAHCEVPCGIYNDQLRIELLMKHFSSIKKAMKQIKDVKHLKEHLEHSGK